MVSVCLPSDVLWQHLPSYLGFSYLRGRISLHGCSSKVQPLFLTLDEGHLLIATPSDLERGIAPLGPPVPAQPLLFGRGVAPPCRRPWPRQLQPAHIAPPRGATPRPRSGAEAGRTPCPRGGGQEELPHVQGQGQWPRVPGCDGAGTAKRSYLTSILYILLSY